MGTHIAPKLVVVDLGRTDYAAAHRVQIATRDALIGGRGPETLLLTEHEPVVTLGRRANRTGIRSAAGLRDAGIDVVETERGGDVTYHGPGQLVAYPILDLRRRGSDLRSYVESLERCVLDVVESYAIAAWADAERHGVYTARGKIASVGVHVTRWVTMHGIALNVDPNMAHWSLISPCNLDGVEATSMAAELPRAPAPAEVRARFVSAFAALFGVSVETVEAAAVQPDETRTSGGETPLRQTRA